MHITLNITKARDMYSSFNKYVKFSQFLKYVKIGKPDECWEWEGATIGKGYEQFKWPEKDISYAHIASYILFIGKIPKRNGKLALKVCHSCDNIICVNPNHLWLGSQKENIEDSISKGRFSIVGKGEDCINSKLNIIKTDKIKVLYGTGKYTQKHLSTKFNVSISTISRIINDKVWVN